LLTYDGKKIRKSDKFVRKCYIWRFFESLCCWILEFLCLFSLINGAFVFLPQVVLFLVLLDVNNIDWFKKYIFLWCDLYCFVTYWFKVWYVFMTWLVLLTLCVVLLHWHSIKGVQEESHIDRNLFEFYWMLTLVNNISYHLLV